MQSFAPSQLPVELWMKVAAYLEPPPERQLFDPSASADDPGDSFEVLDPALPPQEIINLSSTSRYLRDVFGTLVHEVLVVRVCGFSPTHGFGFLPGAYAREDIAVRAPDLSSRARQHMPASEHVTKLAVEVLQHTFASAASLADAIERLGQGIRLLPRLQSASLRFMQTSAELDYLVLSALATAPYLNTLSIRGCKMFWYTSAPPTVFASLKRLEAPLPLSTLGIMALPRLEELREQAVGLVVDMGFVAVEAALLRKLRTLWIKNLPAKRVITNLKRVGHSPSACDAESPLFALETLILNPPIPSVDLLPLLEVLNSTNVPRLRLFVCSRIHRRHGHLSEEELRSRLKAALPSSKVIVYHGLGQDGEAAEAWIKEAQEPT